MKNGNPISKRTWIILAIMMALGLGIRLSYLSYLKTTPGFTHPELDDLYHDYWARMIAFGNAEVPGTVEPPELEQHPYFRPPGYPYFLAAVYKLFGTSPVTIRIIQHVIGLLSALLLFRFVRRWFDESIALVAAGLMLGTWFMVYYEGALNAPVLLMPLIILVIDRLSRLIVEPIPRHALLAGILMGLYALIRPEILTFAPVAALWIVWSLHTQKRRTETVSPYPIEPELARGACPAEASAQRRLPTAPLKLVVCLTMGTIIMIAPATIRNYRVSGETVLVSVNGGINFFFGNNSESDGTTASHSSVGAWTCFDYPRLIRDLSASEGRMVSYSEASSSFVDRALQFIGTHPRQALALTWRKVCLFWGPQEISADNDLESQRRASTLLRNLPTRFSVILGLALTGLLMALWESGPPSQSRRAVMMLLILWILASSITTILFFVSSRYRLPIMPFLFVGVAYALIGLWNLLTTATPARWLPWVAIAIGTQALAAYSPYRITPKPETWHLHAAISCVQNKQLPEAREHLDAAMKISPQNADINYRMGSLYRVEGNTEQAIHYLEKAISLAPTYLMAYIELGSIRAVMKEHDKARALFETAVKISPGSAIANLCLGQTILDSGDMEKALPYFEKAFVLDARLPGGDRFMGSRALQQQDFATAERHFRNWVAASPSNAMAHACLARALAPLGRRDEALEQLDHAFALDPALKAALLPPASTTEPK